MALSRVRSLRSPASHSRRLGMKPDRALSRICPGTYYRGGMVRTVQAGPLTGLIAQLLLLAALAATVGLDAAGWVVGLACALIMAAALARGIVRFRCRRFGPADWVTLTRASLAVGVAALVADSFVGTASVTMIVTLSVVALTLDWVDGWIVRRTGTGS